MERAPEGRFFCVCAGFARVATAVLRMHAIPARCRVGFAAYFNPGFLEDHWVCEFWDGAAWRLLDTQLDEDGASASSGIDFAPQDVPREQFVDASTAWRRLRAGEIDPSRIWRRSSREGERDERAEDVPGPPRPLPLTVLQDPSIRCRGHGWGPRGREPPGTAHK